MQPIRRNGLARHVRHLCVLALACTLVTAIPMPAGAADVRSAKLRVCIDAGHGGGYSGAVSGGVAEKRVNLAVAKYLAAELRARGAEVVMTRTKDTKVYQGGPIRTWRWLPEVAAYSYREYPAPKPADRLHRDLQARTDVARRGGADLYISIHCNAGGSGARGIEVWNCTNDPLGKQYATDVLGAVLKTTGAKSRGVKQSNFYVTRWSNQPACLVECGFITNAGERSRLASSWYQKRLAKGIANGIIGFKRRNVSEPWPRAGGATRYDSAAAVSRMGWPTGSDTVVLAPGESWPEPLVAAPLAASYGAPILTTRPSVLPPPTAAELRRLRPTKLVIVGGANVVSSAVASAAAVAASVAPDAVTRIGGADRYATSIAVARAIESSTTSSVVVASGEVWPDALSVSPSAAVRREPILLSRPTGLDKATYDFIVNSEQTRTVTVVGGPVTLPTSAMQGLHFTRLWGSDRYATNWAIRAARHGYAERMKPVLASGAVYTDATVVGPYAAKVGASVLLFGRGACSPDARPWVYATRDATLTPRIAGGPNSVSAYASAMFAKWEMRSY